MRAPLETGWFCLQECQAVKPNGKVCFAGGNDVELAAVLHGDAKRKHVVGAKTSQAVVWAHVDNGAEMQHVCAGGIHWHNVALLILLDVVPVQRISVRRNVEESHAYTLQPTSLHDQLRYMIGWVPHDENSPGCETRAARSLAA